jgi:hypothetical protein
LTYTLRPKHRVVTPLAHTQSLNTNITNPARFNGARYTVATNAIRELSGVLHAAPMIIPAGVSFDEVGIDVTVAEDADAACRIGLYHNDEVHSGPGNLLAELARFTNPPDGFNSTAIDVAVHETALYWVVVLWEGLITVSFLAGGSLFTGPGGAAIPQGGVNYAGWGYRATGQGTTLPDPILHTDLVGTNLGPNVVLRCNTVPSMTMPVKRARRPLRHQPKEGEDQMQHMQLDAQTAPASMVVVPQDRMFLYPLTLHEPLELVSLNIAPNVITIASSSVDNPTVITTDQSHDMSTGDSIIIAGHTGSTPDINGTHTITVTGATTFTIPVNVTVGGTGGTVMATGDAYVFIYESRADNKPGRLMFADAIDVSTGSPAAATTNMILGPGFYWVGVHHTAASTPTLGGYLALGDNLFSLNGGNYPSAGFYVDDTNSTPSDPFDLSLAQTDAAITPLVTVTHKATGLTLLNAPRRFVPAWPHVYAPDFWVGPSAAPWTPTANKTLFVVNSWALLWIVDRPTTYDQASIEFDFGTSTTTDIRFGIYEDKGYRPGRLMRYLTPSTTITTTDRVDIAITGDLTLMPGIYWLGVSNEDAIGDAFASATGYSQSMGVRGGAEETPRIFFKDSSPLPTTWLATSDAERDGPGIWMRVKNHG